MVYCQSYFSFYLQGLDHDAEQDCSGYYSINASILRTQLRRPSRKSGTNVLVVLIVFCHFRNLFFLKLLSMFSSSFSYPSKTGPLTSPFLAEHSSASGRRLEHRSLCDPEPRHQYRPPWEWNPYPTNGPIASPTCFDFPQDHQGLSSPSGVIFSPSDRFLYAPSGPHFQRGFPAEPRALLGRYSAFGSDSQLLFHDGRNRVLPPGFDQFFDYAAEGMQAKERITPGSRPGQVDPAEWLRSPDGESSEERAGTDSLEAPEKEDAHSSGGCGESQAQSKSFKPLLS